jgi:acyl-CoA thioester hydrolase
MTNATTPNAIHRLSVGDFPAHWQATTRWSDNDMYGHLNNAVYYQLFDAAINGWIIGESAVDPLHIGALGVVAESGCTYFSQLAFPQSLTVGLRISKLGRSSVAYDLGVFPESAAPSEPVAAQGRWVHVYIDRVSRRPVPIPDELRRLFATVTIG